MDTLRPEYLEAVAASRWNLWLFPLFLAAPLLLLAPVLRRWHGAVLVGLALAGAVATWFSVYGYSETIWRTMEANAKTSAEIDEVTSDTGRVFGPFLLGIPFALFYGVIWWGFLVAARALLERLHPTQPLHVTPTAGLVMAAILGFTTGCSRPPVITIQNESSATISNVVVSGTGFTHRIDHIAAGGEQRLTVRPSGESGIRIAFDAGTQQIDSGSQGYFEPAGGYRITATVDTNLNVTVVDDLR
jgi:hypothetical protein